MQSFHISHPPPAQTPPLAPVDTRRLAAREASRVAALKEAAAHRGKGVGAEAQAIYDALKRVCVLLVPLLLPFPWKTLVC